MLAHAYLLGINQFSLNKIWTHGIYIAHTNACLYGFFMNKFIALIVMLLMYMLPALTAPAYAASHEKADAATTTTTDADDKKKKAGEEDEEPECD